MENLKLEMEWDKTFPKSDKVNHRKVTFHNHYGITLAADLYEPKEAAGKLAAIAVCGPFGAVKEQAAELWTRFRRMHRSLWRITMIITRRPAVITSAP